MEPSEVIDKQVENRFHRPTWTAELLAALAKAQAEFPELKKNQTAKIVTDNAAYEYSYVDLAELFKLTRPVLNKHGLAVSQSVSTEGRGDNLIVRIETFLFYSGGGYLYNPLELPFIRTGKMNSIQAIGSVVTYGRRYSYEAIIGIASQEDTDARDLNGNGGESKKSGKGKSGKDGNSGNTESPDMRKELTTLLDRAIASGDDKLKKEAEGAKKSMQNIKDKKSLQNFLNLWKKKVADLPVTPEQVAEAVQGEVQGELDPQDPELSGVFDQS